MFIECEHNRDGKLYLLRTCGSGWSLLHYVEECFCIWYLWRFTGRRCCRQWKLKKFCLPIYCVFRKIKTSAFVIISSSASEALPFTLYTRSRSEHLQLWSPVKDKTLSAVLGAPSALQTLCDNALYKLTLTQYCLLFYLCVWVAVCKCRLLKIYAMAQKKRSNWLSFVYTEYVISHCNVSARCSGDGVEVVKMEAVRLSSCNRTWLGRTGLGHFPPRHPTIAICLSQCTDGASPPQTVQRGPAHFQCRSPVSLEFFGRLCAWFAVEHNNIRRRLKAFYLRYSFHVPIALEILWLRAI